MNLDLAGRSALVVGGSDGVGRAIVHALLQQGVVVAATYAQEGEAALANRLELIAG